MSDTSPTPTSTTAVPSSVVARFTDLYDYQESLRSGADVRIIVTAAGNYEATLTRVNLSQLRIHRGWISLPRIAHSVHGKGRWSLGFVTDSPFHVRQIPVTLNGLETGSADIAFFPPGAEVYHRSFTESHWGSLSLPEESLATAARTLLGRDLTAPADIRLLRTPPPLMSRLRHVHEAVAHLATTVPDILAHSEVARAMEQELLLVMIRCLAEGLPAESGNLRRLHNPVMRRFEQALEAAEDGPLYLAEICASIGVSARTLHQHCMDRLGIGPYRYLWLRRMNLVRQTLLRVDPKETTVTAMANEYGFSELGRLLLHTDGCLVSRHRSHFVVRPVTDDLVAQS